MTIETYSKQQKYIQGMEEYIHSLKKLDKTEAAKEARESLIKSGVLNEDGTVKIRICNL